jgi:MoaA/NifB/PqqE/SkfB family radical SAM enzyme
MPEPAEIAARIRRWPAEGPQGPLVLELYPTLACNLSCRFCDTTDRHRPPVDELPTARLLELVDEAADLGVRRVFILGGGEPLVRRRATPALMRRVKEHGLEGVLTTNGTLLDAALTRQLVETGWDEVHFSLDGATASVHDHLRGQAGAFRKTVRNACRLGQWARRSPGAIPRVAIHFVVMGPNLHQIPDMVRLAAAIGATRIDYDLLVAYRPEQQELALNADQLRALPAIAARARLDADNHGIATTLHLLEDPTIQARGDAPPPLPDGEGLAGAPCLKAWHYLVVQADGRSSPCCVLAGEGGSAASQPLATLWREDPFLERVRNGMLAKQPLPRCRECSANILHHEAAIRRELTTPTERPWPST